MLQMGFSDSPRSDSFHRAVALDDSPILPERSLAPLPADGTVPTTTGQKASDSLAFARQESPLPRDMSETQKGKMPMHRVSGEDTTSQSCGERVSHRGSELLEGTAENQWCVRDPPNHKSVPPFPRSRGRDSSEPTLLNTCLSTESDAPATSPCR